KLGWAHGIWKWIWDQESGQGGLERSERLAGEIARLFGQGSARSSGRNGFGNRGKQSGGVRSQRGMGKQSLKWPAGGEVKVDAASGLTNAGADFEELGAQSFDLCRTPRLRQLLAEEVDQVVGGGMQQQAEGVGQETVATQAVGAEAVLELLDAVLTLAAIVVESEDLRGTTGTVGNQKAQVGSGGGVLGLVAD